MRLLSAKDVAAAVTLREVIEAVETAQLIYRHALRAYRPRNPS